MTRRGFLAIAAAGRRDETLARMAERELAPHEFVLLRTSDGATVARRWSAPAAPAPLGSLVKPFLALAYGETHEQQYPELTCEGCWLPRGHGRIPIGDALAYSCNSYFKQLVERMDREAVRRTARARDQAALQDALQVDHEVEALRAQLRSERTPARILARGLAPIQENPATGRLRVRKKTLIHQEVLVG